MRVRSGTSARNKDLILVLAAACEPVQTETSCDESSLSTCAAAAQTDDHYIDQALRYFDTLDGSADPDSHPAYTETTARWEWPPWLLLTGYGGEQILAVDVLILAAFPETTVPDRDCRAFGVQPFARCRVNIDYEGQGCPIYEEFTFNEAGEVTFVEAWSDLPDMLPTEDAADPWAEAEDVHRLSTRVPGLGSTTGQIDPTGAAMAEAAASDAELADFVDRTQDFWGTWNDAYADAGDDLYARGCGW